MKKSVLFSLVAVFFGEFLSSVAFAGAPPGAGAPAVGPGRPTTLGRRGALSFEVGYYAPSLKTINDDAKAAGFPEIGGNLLLTGKCSFGGAAFPVYPYLGVSYWSSSSTRETDDAKAKATLLSMPVGLEIPILTGTLPQQIMLFLDINGKLVLPFWRYEDTTGYFKAWAVGYDVGTRVGGQFFVVPNVFSIGGTIGYTFLGKTGQLKVTDTTYPGYEVGYLLETTDGEKAVFELSGITLMFDIRLWF